MLQLNVTVSVQVSVEISVPVQVSFGKEDATAVAQVAPVLLFRLVTWATDCEVVGRGLE